MNEYTVKKQTWATGEGYYIVDANGVEVSDMYADEDLTDSICALLNAQTNSLRDVIADLERQLDDAHNTIQGMD